METIMKNPVIDTEMKKKMNDILLAISWREMARTYFGKSASWLYHKLDGIDGNGKQGGFTPTESQQMKGALYDLSERIRKCADKI